MRAGQVSSPELFDARSSFIWQVEWFPGGMQSLGNALDLMSQFPRFEDFRGLFWDIAHLQQDMSVQDTGKDCLTEEASLCILHNCCL